MYRNLRNNLHSTKGRESKWLKFCTEMTATGLEPTKMSTSNLSQH